jgi:hypothetical protein
MEGMKDMRKLKNKIGDKNGLPHFMGFISFMVSCQNSLSYIFAHRSWQPTKHQYD